MSMIVWQADFYHLSRPSADGETPWRLTVCDPEGILLHESQCPRAVAGADWLTEQLRSIEPPPDIVRVFRPQCAGLFRIAAERLGWRVEFTRHVRALKRLLQAREIPIALDRPPPLSIPENLLGREWRFARIPAGDLIEFWSDRPLPIRSIPEEFHPLTLGLASTVPIPGIVIDGGRKSMDLALWIEEQVPVSIEHIPTEADRSGGLVLESGLVDRWILATYEDEEVARAARLYGERLHDSRGVHFLLIEPDDSGRTFTGFWLLRQEEKT
ncbi:Tab2 family RNA-binding protein [Pannus brasiliensis CCIBt3594]|uniref:Tab2 family RNA-binding protein n=2 Tax=Pannus TaxID=1427526 RepID=A0AAW9QL95_9CHRO